MKILQVHHRYWPYPGGSERYIQEIAERFVNDGHDAAVITTDAWDIEHFFFRGKKIIEKCDETHNGVSIKRIPVRKFPLQRYAFTLASLLPSLALKSMFAYPSPFVPSLGRELNNIGHVDVVHTAAFPYTSLVYRSYAFAKKRNIPFLITPFIHFGEPHDVAALIAKLSGHHLRIFQESDLIIVQTTLEKEVLCRLPLRRDKIVVVGVGVNPGELTEGNGPRFRAKHGIAADDIVILHVAEKSFIKGSIHLVEAVRRLLSRNSRIKIVLGGSSMKDFQQYVDDPRIAVRDICVFPGYVPEKEKKDMFAACDIFAMPSKTDTFGIVYLEAWLSRKPVIGAMAGGVPEVITDGVDGFLVPFGNVPMLEEYLWKLINSRDLRDRMGANGYMKASTLHTWENKYAVFRDIVLELINKRQVSLQEGFPESLPVDDL